MSVSWFQLVFYSHSATEYHLDYSCLPEHCDRSKVWGKCPPSLRLRDEKAPRCAWSTATCIIILLSIWAQVVSL